jgi:DedD protein
MEKKKLLLVAISVGVFLALTIGAALLFFAPRDVSTSATAYTRPVQAVDTGITVPSPSPTPGPSTGQDSSPQSSSPDPVELVNATPGLREAPEGTGRQGEEFYINGNNAGAGKTTETVISVPKPSTAAVPDTAPAGKAASTPAQTQTAPKPAATAVATTTASVQTQTKPASTQTKVYNDYWVQTGAFSTIARAEGVKNTLSSKGITSIIENREVEGKTVFRVRVGPYTSQNEANYWLSLIKSINGFEDSQIRQTQTLR